MNVLTVLCAKRMMRSCSFIAYILLKSLAYYVNVVVSFEAFHIAFCFALVFDLRLTAFMIQLSSQFTAKLR